MSATTDGVMELVKEIVEPRLREQVTIELDLLGSKLIDSFGLIRLVGELEQKFGIAIRTEDMTVQSFTTAGSIAELVERYQAGPT